MVCRTAFALAALLLSVPPASADEQQPASFRLSSLPAGQKLSISTAQRQYRVQLIDNQTGEALVAGSTDGKEFSQPETMFLVGATRESQPDDGGFSLVLMGELCEGMQIEWGRGSLDPQDRGTTSPVRSITLDR